MAMNFSDVAKKRASEIERPPLPPVGEYIFVITKIPAINENVQDKWDIVEYTCKVVSPMESVDPDAIQAYGDVTRVQLRLSFMFEKADTANFMQTEFNHKRFLTEHVKCMSDDQSIFEGMNASVHQQFVGTISWKADKKDAEVFHANITRTAPLS